jgi:hypothetical protein
VSLLAEPALVVTERLVAATIRSRSLAALLPLPAGLAAIWGAVARIAGGRTGRDSVDRSGDGGDSGLACARIPDGVGVAGHVGGGLVIGGGQVVSHRGGQPQQEQRQEDCVVAARPLAGEPTSHPSVQRGGGRPGLDA